MNSKQPPARSKTRTLADEAASVGRSWERVQGTAIGRYLIQERLGAGAMGVVYRARDPELDREVAIKMIHPSRAGTKRSLARFIREARAMARLAHPNVVAVFDFGVSHGEAYLVMELVEASTLNDWLRSEPRVSERLRVMLQAGHGLAAAHAEGIVHRDIKPQNVLIGAAQNARVTDFGLAVESTPRAQTDESFSGLSVSGSVSPTATATCDGAVIGSPAYMSPEQHRGEQLDARSDQYSYCITLFETLCGRRPFDARGLQRLLLAKEGEADIDWTGVPRRFVTVLERGLSPDARDRFSTMDALLAALESPRLRGRYWIPALVLGATAAAGLANVRGQAKTCAEGARQIESTWNPGQAAAVRDAFEATGHPLAKSTATRVLPLLDEQAAAWAASYTAVCDTAKAEELDARMACLHEHREHLSELAQKLTAIERANVERAVSSAGRMSSPNNCLDEGIGGLGYRVRLDATGRTAVENASAYMRSGKQALRTGRADDALEDFAASIAVARSTQDAASIINALTKIGNLEDDAGEPELARQHLEEALELSVSIGSDDRAAAALVHLVWVEGVSLGDVDAGIRRVREAQAFLARSGGEPRKEAALLNNHAVLLQIQGDVEGARETLLRARLVWEGVQPATAVEQIVKSTAMAMVNMNIAAMSYLLGDLDSAVEAYLQSYRGISDAKGPNHPDAADVLIDLAQAYERQGKNELAVENAQRALDVMVLNRGERHPDASKALFRMGDSLYGLGRWDAAFEAYDRGIEVLAADLGKQHGDVHVRRLEKAEMLVEAGSFAEAAPLANAASNALARAGHDYVRARAMAHTVLARVALADDRHGDARLEADAAAAVMVVSETGNTERDWTSTWISIAYTYRELASYDESVHAAQEAFNLQEPSPNSFRGRMAAIQLATSLAARGHDGDRKRAEALLARTENRIGDDVFLDKALTRARTLLTRR